MKKFTGVVAILFALSLLAAGCSGGGGGSNVTEPQDQKKVTETKPKPTVVKEEPKRPPKTGAKSAKTEPEVTAPKDGDEATALETVYYEYDKSRITKEAADILKANSAVMTADAALRVRIEGHCDERGTKEYNQALGERRANSSMQYLKNLGVGLDRMETISYGEERPAVEGANEAAWAKNRRSEFKRIK